MNQRVQGREEIVRAAQTLFARRGIDLVTSRQILALARQRNQSAVQYHFGSRDGLIRAAFLEPFQRIDERRVELLAATDRERDPAALPSVERLLEAIVIPLVEQAATEEGRDYIRFAAQVIQRPGFEINRLTSDRDLPGLRRAITGLRNHTRDLQPAVRTLRSQMVLHLVFGTLRSWVDGRLGSTSRSAITRELLGVLSDVVGCRATGVGTSRRRRDDRHNPS